MRLCDLDISPFDLGFMLCDTRHVTVAHAKVEKHPSDFRFQSHGSMTAMFFIDLRVTDVSDVLGSERG